MPSNVVRTEPTDPAGETVLSNTNMVSPTSESALIMSANRFGAAAVIAPIGMLLSHTIGFRKVDVI